MKRYFVIICLLFVWILSILHIKDFSICMSGDFFATVTLTVTVLIIVFFVLNINKKIVNYNKFIEIDTTQIKFCSPISPYLNSQETARKPTLYNVFYEGSTNNIPYIIGKVYIPKSNLYIFEDNLTVVRHRKANYTRPIYATSDKFLPFVDNIDWYKTGTTDNYELTEKIKNEIVKYYTKCNDESLKNQMSLNYDDRRHRKFAVMDHIIRSCKKPIGMAHNHYGVAFDLGVDNDHIFAINELRKENLISWNYLEQINQLTPLGRRSSKIGYRIAHEFDIAEIKNFEELIRSKHMVWISWVIAILTLFVPIILTLIEKINSKNNFWLNLFDCCSESRTNMLSFIWLC